jgi:hypothetical protein
MITMPSHCGQICERCRNQNPDPLVPHQRRKTARETPDEAEQRLNADLRALMNDARYRKNDGDFRHDVQRQYRRVYDDPTGERPKHLTIGRPKTYASDLEPFDRHREQLLRRQTEAEESGGAEAKRAGGGGPLRTNVRVAKAQSNTDGSGGVVEEHDIYSPEERAATQPWPGENNRAGPTPGVFGSGNETAVQRYLDIQEARTMSNRFLDAAVIAGWDEAIRAHEHYREGSGDPLAVNAEIVEGYEPVENAQRDNLQYLSDWLEGKLIDPRFGRPWLDLVDVERITIGNEAFDPDHVGDLVRWEATFDGPGETDADYWTDARMTFNAGTLQGFSQLTLERHGDRIDISGFVKFRVVDRYDFKPGHFLKSKTLEDYESAKSFDISTTFWVRPISGWMDISGAPVPRVHLTFDD